MTEIIPLEAPYEESCEEIIDLIRYVLILAHEEPIERIAITFEIDGFKQHYEQVDRDLV